MSQSPDGYRVGDVVDGWRLRPDGSWEPATAPPAPQLIAGVPQFAPAGTAPQHASATWPASPHEGSSVSLLAPEWASAPGGGSAHRRERNTPAVFSLTLGIVAVVGNVFFVPGLLALIAGIFGIDRSRSLTARRGRAMSVWGIVLAVLGSVSGVMWLGIFAPQDTPTTWVSGAVPTTGADAGDDAAPPPPADVAEFVPLDARGWAQIVKDPDGSSGMAIVVFAEVTQFDAATGREMFRANAGAEQPTVEFELVDNTIFVGDAAALDGVMAGDVIKVHATVDGAETYDTAIGGAATAPRLRVDSAEVVGFKDLSGDVVLAAATRDEFGYVSVPVTVVNSASKPMTYHIDLVAESPDGAQQISTATAYVENLAPGQSAAVTADFYEELPPDAAFRVVSIDRYAY
jgi:hypothetical protein